MGSPRFVSPGAMGGNAIEQFLMQQAAMKRQAQMDQLQQAHQAEQEQRAQQALKLQQEQEARIAAKQQQDAAQQQSQAALAQSKTANEQGVRTMMADAMSQGPLTPELAQQIGVMGFREGIQTPAMVSQAMTPPKADPLAEYEAKKVIDQKYEKPAAPKEDNEPLQAVMGPDGQPVLVPRHQAIGKRPASTREQGRPVTSSDAGRMADIDTSLSDVDTLERDLGTTGAGSQIGAALPNVITEMTGLGEDSKRRQAVIDRVKQVIGKVLEGGVLRKEDEVKYAKILPTIGDPPEVAKAKIAGLREALGKRKQTFIEALTDANYDTTKFSERNPQKPQQSAPAAGAQSSNGRVYYDMDGNPVQR